MRGALIDDVALGTLLKKDGNRTWLGLATESAPSGRTRGWPASGT